MLPAWKRFWHWKKSKSTMFMEALAQMSDLDMAKITEDALGYRLPQFDRGFEAMNTCSIPNQFQDDKLEKPQTISSKSNGIEHHGRHFEEKEYEPEDIAVDRSDNGVVVEMSSFSPSSPYPSARDGDTSRHHQITSNIDSVARRLSVFANPKSKASIFKLPSTEVSVADSTELREVVISGGSSHIAAGVGQVQWQQQLRIAHAGQALQRDAVAVDNDCLPPESTPRAAVIRTKTLAALALNPRGTGSINAFKAAVQKSIEARDDQSHERERSPFSKAALPLASASSQPGLRPSAHVTALQRQVHSAAAQLHIPQSPPRSRSRSRNTAAATIDPPASLFVVPPPPPRSRSSSRSRISAGTQALANAKSPPESRVLDVPVAIPVPDVATFQPPDAAKHPPDSATRASGGSVRAGPSSKKAASKQPKKSATDLAFEKAQAEYEESMRRMERDGVSFAEC